MTGVFRAEVQERTRRFSYLAMIAMALVAAFWFVPRNDDSMQVMSIQPDVFIQAGNASWIPVASAWGLGFFLPLVGFFYLKNTLSDDLRNGLHQYIRTSPLGNVRYALGKWVAGITLLYGVTIVVMFGSFVMMLIHFPGEWLSPHDFLTPYAYLLTVIPLFLAVALFFDSTPVLRGVLGSIAFIAAFITMYTLAAMETAPPWLRLVDVSGSTIIIRTIQDAVLEQSGAPLTILMFLGGGDFDCQPALQLVFHGTQLTLADIGGLAGMLGIAFVLVLASAPLLELSARANRIRLPKPTKPRKTAVHMGSPVYTPAKAHSSMLLSAIRAEFVLLTAGQKPFFWLVAPVGWIACIFTPLDVAQGVLLPLLLLWFVNVFSALGSREHRSHLLPMVISSPGGIVRQTLAAWASGVLLALTAALPLIVRHGIAGNAAGVAACTAGAVFLPALALSLGAFSKTPRVFEVTHIIGTYLILNGVSVMMYMGAPDAASFVFAAVYATFGIGLGVLTAVKRVIAAKI